MSSYEGAVERKSGLSWGIGLLITFLLHGGIIGGVIVMQHMDANAQHTPLLAVDGQVVDVQAVKFGKPRDLSFLPHKEAVIHNKGPKPKLALSENDKALPHLKDPNDKTPEIDDPLKTAHSKLFENVNEPEQPGVEEVGDPNGVKGGTATVGKGPIYLQHLVAAVQNVWTIPTTISDEKLSKLKAMVCVTIDPTGKIVDPKIKNSSGDDGFDSTLLNALGSIKDFEAPTPDVKELVAGGVCMNFVFGKSR